jgi:hypothetical protein
MMRRSKVLTNVATDDIIEEVLSLEHTEAKSEKLWEKE